MGNNTICTFTSLGLFIDLTNVWYTMYPCATFSHQDKQVIGKNITYKFSCPELFVIVYKHMNCRPKCILSSVCALKVAVHPRGPRKYCVISAYILNEKSRVRLGTK